VIIASGGSFRCAPAGGFPNGKLDPEAIPRLASVLEVLPTILAVKGLPVGEDMDGTPVLGMIDPAKLDPSAIRTVPTHDTPEWLAEQKTRIRRAEDEKERLEQLRSLGYIK